nr:GDP-fucose protein O-fucosyltransferase [Ipomoea batatas]
MLPGGYFKSPWLSNFFVNCSNSLLVTCINESKQNDLLESRISPGSNAAVAFTKPLPISKGVAGDWFMSGLAYARWASMGPPPLSYTDAVVESADPIAAGVNVGNFCLIKAARPATCGAAMLVPDIIAKLSPKKCLMQSWIKLKTYDKRIHIKHNTSCTEVAGSFQGLFDGGKPKHKPDRVATY